MKDTQPSSGIYERNSGWIQPLLAAFVLLVAPTIIQSFEIVDSGFLIPLGSSAALVAVGFAGFKARLTDTLLAKVVSHVAVLGGLFLAAIQLFQSF